MKNIIIATLSALLLISCSDADSGWEMVWNDEFNYTGLPDSTRWSYDTKGNAYGWGNHEAEFYTDKDADNAYVSKGKLRITARKEDMGGKHYTSARLMTKGKGDWKYGKVEVRAKLPTGRGTWPAIWMLPTVNHYGGWPASGEIDIMENVGYDPETIVCSSHTKAYNHKIKTQKNNRIRIPDCYRKFHVYRLEWDENQWSTYVDDQLVFTYTRNDEGFQQWPYDQKFFLILNLAIGGGWGGREGIDDSIFPQTFEIDYVRVYQKE